MVYDQFPIITFALVRSHEPQTPPYKVQTRPILKLIFLSHIFKLVREKKKYSRRTRVGDEYLFVVSSKQ